MKLYVFLILQLLFFSAQAQHSIHVTGTIVDSTSSQPVEAAYAALMKDSINLEALLVDSTGKFEFKKVAPGIYTIRYGYVGYEDAESAPFIIAHEDTLVDMGALPLSLSKDVDHVVVIGQKETFENSIDRKIYNVNADIQSQSGSLSDVLQNVPSVSVDIDGNVSLRGAENVTIFINGKPSTLLGSSPGEVLQQIPASAVERIEIITNPSAKYKPDGTGGIINIVLKKNAKLGFNGSARINAGNYSRYNGSIAMNYNPGKINFFGSYSLRRDQFFRYNKDFRIYTDTSTQEVSYQDQVNNHYGKPLSHLLSAGADFHLTKKNEAGLSSNFSHRGFIRGEDTDYLLKDENQIVTSNYIRYRNGKERDRNFDLNSYFRHLFNEKGHSLNFNYYFSQESDREDNGFLNVYYIPLIENSYDKTLTNEKNTEHLATIEYKLPISEETEFEAGYMGQFDKTDVDYFAQIFTYATGWQPSAERSNHFISNQNVHAFYSTYSSNFKKIRYLAGLRAEQSFISSRLITLDSIVPNNYFQLFPTLHLSYKFKMGHELQLNYSRRINRPDGEALNPFPEYTDPRNLDAGNPLLMPENIHSVELGYLWKAKRQSFNPTLFYRYRDNGFTRVRELIRDSVLLTTEKNLASNQSAGLELITTHRIGNALSMNTNGRVFYNEIDASNLGLSSRKSNWTWSMKVNASLVLGKNTMMQMNASYQAAMITPQGKMLPRYFVNWGMKQDLFKSKCSVTLTVSDLFNTLRMNMETDTPWLQQSVIRKRQSRIVYLGFVYKFGMTLKKGKGEKMEFEDSFRE